MSIVHHARYVVYLEEARIQFAKEIGIDFATVVREGFNLAVIDLQITYKRPLLFGQVVDIYCWLHELKSRGMTFSFELRANDLEATHATAQVGLLSVSNTGIPTRIPDPYFQSLQATINSVNN